MNPFKKVKDKLIQQALEAAVEGMYERGYELPTVKKNRRKNSDTVRGRRDTNQRKRNT